MLETSVSLLPLACDAPDSEAWQRLADIYSPLLHASLRRYDVQPADAEDLIQDVLLTVSRELPKFEHSGRAGAFRGWLRTILVHRLRNFWRSRQYPPLAAGGSTWAEWIEQLADDSAEVTGQPNNSTGQWDEAAKTFTWKLTDANGLINTAQHRFVGDKLDWTVLVENPQKVAMFRMEGTSSKAKETKSPVK